MNIIEVNLDKIRKLCVNYKVSRMFVFGSVLKDSFNQESDIDLIVDFENVELSKYADNYFDLKQQVDLLEEKAIRNPFLRKAIDKEKQLIYG